MCSPTVTLFVFAVIVMTTVSHGALINLSGGDKKAILDAHNRMREQTALGRTPKQPSAANMLALEWDDRLMKSAARWVKKCVVGHDEGSDRALPGFTWVGQNWAGGHSREYQSYVKMWFDEYSGYNFNSGSCSGVCGHYTQVVWAATSRVGCAAAKCSKYPVHFVCNYAPGGNFNNEKPYVSGPPGSKCPKGYSARRGSGLCRRK